MITLRPHHLLCMQFFIGKGYSQAFTDNMKQVLSRLQTNPQILLTDGGDDLCRACPNYKDEICENEEKVCAYDRNVAAYLSLQTNAQYDYLKLSRQIQGMLQRENLPQILCKDCQWLSVCTAQRENIKIE